MRGLYGLEKSACSSPAAAGEDTAAVDQLFCPLLDEAARPRIGSRFADLMAERFEGSAAEPADEEITAEVRLRSKVAASLRLSRAQIWTVDKPAGTDGYLPLTLTLDLTDIASGEVLRSWTRSDIAQGIFADHEARDKLAEALRPHIDQAMLTLVQDARAAWRPYKQTVRVLGPVGDNFVIDQGRISGIRRGDSIGGDGTVVYAGPNYAIVRTELDRLVTGQEVSRTATAPVELLARPSVLPVFAALPDGYAWPYLAGVFADALGATGKYAPVHVNPGYANMRETMLGNEGVAKRARSFPDYMASIRVVALDPASFPSNLSSVAVERHEAHAFATLSDPTGRIVAAFHGVGRITDEVPREIRFSREQRRDTVVRNALIDLAELMARYVPQSKLLEIEVENGRMVITDLAGLLPRNVQLEVLRRERVDGVKDTILVPVGEVEVGTPEATGRIEARDVGVVRLKLRQGDVVAAEVGERQMQSRRVLQRCSAPDDKPALDDRGTVPMPLFGEAADQIFAAQFGGPVFDHALPGALAKVGVEFGNWEGFGAAQPRKPDACFTPVIAVQPSANGYMLTAGYTLFEGQQKIGASGMQSFMTPTQLPANASEEARRSMLQMDLADKLLPLAGKAAAALAAQRQTIFQAKGSTK